MPEGPELKAIIILAKVEGRNSSCYCPCCVVWAEAFSWTECCTGAGLGYVLLVPVPLSRKAVALPVAAARPCSSAIGKQTPRWVRHVACGVGGLPAFQRN